jgi:hypothetical protein
MTARRADHPTATQLAAFAAGGLHGADAAALAAHLDACPACRRAAAKLAANAPVNAGPFQGDTLPPDAGSAPAPPAAGGRPPAAAPGLPPELASHPRYRILRELGRGGMGVVYHAEQTLMDRQVAIKVINRALLDHPDALERFGREVRAAAKLSHPNIVLAYDAERAGDLHLLVMEFVEGLNLADVVQRKGPLPVAHACSYVRQAALGLQHAFERGMIHRDIKPHNLMLTPKGQVKILDFGLAKLARERGPQSEVTAQGTYMGTPDYTAPEQASDARSADIRADIYSLGCTLYFLLAGRPPFQEGTDVKTIIAHLEKEPPPLTGLRADVPPDLAAVVARMLAKDPARRYQKPAEVAQALAPFCKRASNLVPVAAPAPPAAAAEAATVPPRDTTPLPPVARPAPPLAATAPMRPAAPAPAPAPAPRRWGCVLLVGLVLFILVLIPLGLVGGVLLGLVLTGPESVAVVPSTEPGPAAAKADEPAATSRTERDDTRPPATTEKAPPAGIAIPPVGGGGSGGGFVSLFNGKDLTGWKVYPEGTGQWKVENGALVSSGPPSHLFTERGDFHNFHLRLEALINVGGDSGVFFRSEFGPGVPEGYEAQIDVTPRVRIKTGSLYLPGVPEVLVGKQLHRPNEWFTQEVIAEGNHIIIKVNDQTTVDWRDPKNSYARGHFALQQEHPGTVVKFRKIEVLELPRGRPARPNR